MPSPNPAKFHRDKRLQNKASGKNKIERGVTFDWKWIFQTFYKEQIAYFDYILKYIHKAMSSCWICQIWNIKNVRSIFKFERSRSPVSKIVLNNVNNNANWFNWPLFACDVWEICVHALNWISFFFLLLAYDCLVLSYI